MPRSKSTARGGAGTSKLCQACNWPIKAARGSGVTHGGEGVLCTWNRGELPRGICKQPLGTHTSMCGRPSGFSVSWDDLLKCIRACGRGYV